MLVSTSNLKGKSCQLLAYLQFRYPQLVKLQEVSRHLDCRQVFNEGHAAGSNTAGFMLRKMARASCTTCAKTRTNASTVSTTRPTAACVTS